MFELFAVMKVGLQLGRRSVSINHVEIKKEWSHRKHFTAQIV